MKRVKAALRTARVLLAQGNLGNDLREALNDAHPGLNPQDRERVAAAVKKEVGILGQILHDPNLYKNCRVASKEKESHPNKHRLILTHRTPLCATCSFNKNGRCGLMGGKLVDNAQDIGEDVVHKTASLLVSDGVMTQSEANQITKAKIPPARRAASLNLRITLPVLDQAADARGEAQSRRLAAMLDPSEQSIVINSAARKGPRKANNRDAYEEEQTLSHQPGDERVAKRAMQMADMLQSADFRVEIPDAGPAPREVRLAAKSVFDVPEFQDPDYEHGRHASAMGEDHVAQVQEEYEKILRTASKQMSDGQMDLERAHKAVTRLDALSQYGARTSKRARRLITQLQAMSGHLEL